MSDIQMFLGEYHLTKWLMLMYIKFWAFSRRSGCQMSKPPQVTQVVYNLWKIVDANIHKCGYSWEGLDIKCPSLLKIVYHLTKWWILMYIIFGHFLEGLDVKCPNRLMILKLCICYGNHGHWYSQIWIFFRRFGCQVSKFPLDFVSPNKIQDVDVHNSRYSHEGLDSNVKTTLWYSSVYILWK